MEAAGRASSGHVDAGSVPELVPARMLNEFVYCPRLFYLEWVEGLWDDNADTAVGSLEHARSDRGGGRMPAPDDAAEQEWSGAARSVSLDAPRLGLVAKIDLVEGEDGTVSPVDHKVGRPRPDGTAWDPERIQLAAQLLILRENGYRAERGYLSYRGSRTRIEVQAGPDVEQEVSDLLVRLRQVAAATEAPPPFVDSPKCPRCSLVSICLPDETNALRLARERRTVRRLIAARPEVAPLYVQEPGAYVRLSGGRIEVVREGEILASLRLVDVLEVALFGGASISGPTLRELALAGVPVTHFSFGGRFQALTVGLEPNNVELRIASSGTPTIAPPRSRSLARSLPRRCGTRACSCDGTEARRRPPPSASSRVSLAARSAPAISTCCSGSREPLPASTTERSPVSYAAAGAGRTSRSTSRGARADRRAIGRTPSSLSSTRFSSRSARSPPGGSGSTPCSASSIARASHGPRSPSI